MSDQSSVEFYEVDEAADRAKVGVDTIRKWARDGHIRAFKSPGGRHWRILAEPFDRQLRGEIEAA